MALPSSMRRAPEMVDVKRVARAGPSEGTQGLTWMGIVK